MIPTEKLLEISHDVAACSGCTRPLKEHIQYLVEEYGSLQDTFTDLIEELEDARIDVSFYMMKAELAEDALRRGESS